MPTILKVIIAIMIIAIGVGYWYLRSTIEPVQYTPVTSQTEKTP